MKPLLLTVAALLASAVSLAAAAPSSLDVCVDRFLAHPLDVDAGNCFPEVAGHKGQEGQVLARIDLLLGAGRADDPVLLLNRARVLARLPDADSAPVELRREHDLRTAVSGFAQRLDVRESFSARANLWRLLIHQGRRVEARSEVSGSLAAVGLRSTATRAAGVLVARALLLEGKQLLAETRDLARAERLLLVARPYFSPPGQEPYQADLLRTLANVWRELGARQDALAAYVELEGLAARPNLASYKALSLYGQASVKLETLAELEDAETRAEVVRLARRALERAHGLGDAKTEANARWMLARLVGGAEAEAFLAGCLALPTQPTEQAYCLAAKAELELREHRREEGKAALNATRKLANTAGDPYFAAQLETSLFEVIWALDPPRQALAESRQALAAIERLRGGQRRGSEEQAEMFSTWTDPYHQLAGHLFAGGDLAQAFEVLEHLRARALLDAVDDAGPPAAHPSSFASVEEVSRHLAPDQALLSFQVAPDRDWARRFGGGSWLLTITKGRPPRLDRLPADRGVLRTEIEGWETAIVERSPQEARMASRLYRQLLAPAISSLPREVRRLVVIPDDHLHRLPWAALRSTSAAEPLVDQFEISVAPSATWWLGEHRAPAKARPAAALILADPPAPASLPALPDAADEGRAVRRAIGGDSLLLTGARATEDALNRVLSLPRYAVVHVAAHAQVDERHPAGSVIFLAADRHQDGHLTPAEISTLPWNGMLAYLSACESQRGRVLRGEGTMSLARAFFAGRARTVVANLWRVRDDEAFNLARRFYRHLGSGDTAAAALQAAQRETVRAGLPTASWAGLTVLGDGDLALAPASGVDAKLALVLVALAAIAGLVAGLRARRPG